MLRTEPEIRRWIEWVAPRVLQVFRATNEGDPDADVIAAPPLRVATLDAEAPRDVADDGRKLATRT